MDHGVLLLRACQRRYTEAVLEPAGLNKHATTIAPTAALEVEQFRTVTPDEKQYYPAFSII